MILHHFNSRARRGNMAQDIPNFNLNFDLSMDTSDDEVQTECCDQPNFDLGINEWLEFSNDEDDNNDDENVRQANFDLGMDEWLHFSSDEEMEVDMNHKHDQPNFDLGIDEWLDFTSDEESDSDNENGECIQEGFGDLLYILENTTERYIAKFNVTGSEYRLQVPAIDRQYTYNEAVQLLHRILRGNNII